MKYYIILIFSVFAFASCSENKAANKAPAVNKTSSPLYQLAVIKNAGVATTIKLPAQLVAYEEVNIFPKVNGYVKDVLVDIGSKVSKGQLLMTLEAPELVQASLESKEKYERAKADYSIDQEHYQRLQEASKTPGAISPLDLSTIKAKMDADNALCNAANANWQMQKTMMSYLSVTAPFAGVITQRNVHPGALVSAEGTNIPMLELKQIEHLRLQVDIPEGVAATLKINDSIWFYTSAFPGKKLTGLISRKSNNIDEQYRFERMEIDVLNKDGVLAPGMYADVVLQSKGNSNAMSVPKSAVVTSTERKYVLTIKNNVITKVDVSTGNETINNIEIYGPLQPGDSVITNANDEIEATAK
jgi:membrane fusion protein (multidrug efflux system)